jgi:1,4-alpha-glucan branching enzyme
MAEKIVRRRITFTYQAPEAEAVFLAGTFNGWNCEANPLKKNKEGIWSTSLNLFPGHYEYRFIVDGRWEDDPNCQRRHLNRFGDYDCILRMD